LNYVCIWKRTKVLAQKRFEVGLMAAILKFKMTADRGRFLSGTRPEMN
jgi:hypothetical protein